VTSLVHIALNDYLTEVLVRYFRKSVAQDFDIPRLHVAKTERLLAQCWAFSGPARVFVTYLANHVHELQAVLNATSEICKDGVRGRIDPRRTMVLQALTGQPTWTVCIAPSRTHDSGPNRILCWVLKRIAELLRERYRLTVGEPSHSANLGPLLNHVESLLRFEPIRNAMAAVSTVRRPGNRDLTEALRSRRPVYRCAGAAYKFLLEIEAGDPRALRDLLNETVLGPAPLWQRFELAAGLGSAEAIAAASGLAFSLHVIVPGTYGPFATVGNIAIHWQSQTDFYLSPEPEPSEKLVADLLGAIGLTSGGDRPDFVVVDHSRREVLALAEVKYFENDDDDGATAIRAAVDQLVTYARGYKRPANVLGLVDASTIVLASSARFTTKGKESGPQPWIVDFEGLRQGALIPWARQTISFAVVQPS
jgi:hypothetical protein